MLAQSIVKLSWLIDNSQCAVVTPLTSDLDISLGDMQELRRRPRASARCSQVSRSPKDSLDDAIAIGKLQFTVQFTKNRLYPAAAAGEVLQEGAIGMEYIGSPPESRGEIGGSLKLTQQRMQPDLNNSQSFKRPAWDRHGPSKPAKPSIESVQDESFKQDSSQRTVINRYRERRTVRRNSAARSNRDRHRFSFDFMGSGLETNNVQAQFDSEGSSPGGDQRAQLK